MSAWGVLLVYFGNGYNPIGQNLFFCLICQYFGLESQCWTQASYV